MSALRRVARRLAATRERRREEAAYQAALSRWAQRSHYNPVGAGPQPDKPEHRKDNDR